MNIQNIISEYIGKSGKLFSNLEIICKLFGSYLEVGKVFVGYTEDYFGCF